ncbi:hypothetical protein ACOBQX_03065 [Actinokineospora sp. G85]|uniref:nSTAND1 domain-containing NTPase n=1 Tax=Actinokineospora sp. G85 TaxID=3406626 RepID=UPI003C72564A
MRRNAARLRTLGIDGGLAVVAAGAFAPFLTEDPLAAGVTLGAGLGVNIGSDLLLRLERRFRRGKAGESEAEVCAVIESVLVEELASRESDNEAGRRELVEALERIGALDELVGIVREAVNDPMAVDLVDLVVTLSKEFTAFAPVIEGLDERLDRIQDTLQEADARQWELLRSSRSHSRQLEHLARRLDDIRFRSQPDAASAARGAEPYRGLYPFSPDDAEIFFGRDRLASNLLQRVKECLGDTNILIVTGASGVGKSSLVHAGLLPRIAAGHAIPGSQHWLPVLMTPTANPLEVFATHVAALAGVSATAVRDSLTADPAEVRVLLRQGQIAGIPAQERLGRRSARTLIVIDKFEEVFSVARHDAEAADVFFDVLAEASTAGRDGVDAPAVVLLVVRADYLEQCAAVPRLNTAMENSPFVVTTMTESDIRQAIIGPATHLGYEVEPRLDDTIVADLRSSITVGSLVDGALPLLSQALRETWQRSDGHTLTSRAYNDAGGVVGAVQKSADEVYCKLTEEQKKLAKRIFRALTRIRIDGVPTGRRSSRAELTAALGQAAEADVSAVIDAFTDKRLLIVDESRIEIAHDALIEVWPLLKEWLADDIAAFRTLDQLDGEVRRWMDHEHGTSYLHVGKQLKETVSAVSLWETDPDRYPLVTPDLARFLGASLRWNRWIRLRAAFVLVVAVSAFGVAVVTNADRVTASRVAEERGRTTVQQKLFVQSEQLLRTDPRAAQRLAAAAYRLNPTAEGRLAMLTTLVGSRQREVWDSGAKELHRVAVSGDGRTVAIASEDDQVLLIDAETFSVKQRLPGHIDGAYDVDFSPDQRTVVTAGADGRIFLWDKEDGEPLRQPINAHNGIVRDLAFASESVVASAGIDGKVRLWELSTGALLADSGAAISSAVNSLAFNGDNGKLYVAAGDDVHVLDGATLGRLREPLHGHSDQVNKIAIGLGGRLLVSAADDGTIRMWDTAGHTPTGVLRGHTGYVQDLVFLRDSEMLASAGADKTIRLWDIAAQRQLDRPLIGHTGHVMSLATFANGTLASAGDDGTMRHWNVTNRLRSGKALGAGPETAWAVDFSPDGKSVASASEDGGVRRWVLETRAQLPSYAGHAGDVLGLEHSSDGGLLVTGGVDATVKVWDTRIAGGAPRRFDGHRGLIRGVAISPDNQTIASVGEDNLLRFWGVRDGETDERFIPVRFGRTFDVAYSRRGDLMATAGEDAIVRLWDPRTRSFLGELRGHEGPITAIVFSPDGSILASVSEDQSLRLWNVESRERIGGQLNAHTGFIHGVSFSPDGSMIATAGDDGVLVLWDTGTGRVVGDPVHGHSSAVESVDFSPDGTKIATSGRDGTVHIWDVNEYLEPEKVIDSRAGRMTEQEWKRYAPGQDLP